MISLGDILLYFKLHNEQRLRALASKNLPKCKQRTWLFNVMYEIKYYISTQTLRFWLDFYIPLLCLYHFVIDDYEFVKSCRPEDKHGSRRKKF